jgi:Arc/MetJ-type ribon-helix-helix transcriptional regulator
MPAGKGQTQFNVTLPDQVIETMMTLKSSGLYGTNRAEIARALIQDMLKRLAAEGQVKP